jgi:hypothetical protein
MEKAAAVLLIVLIVLYFAMLLVLAFRAKAFKYFGKGNKEVRAFYVSIIVFLGLRVVGLIVVVTLSDFIGKDVVFVLLEVPRAASIIPFVLLAIIKLNKTFEGHMMLHINKTFIEGVDKKPRLQKFKPLIFSIVFLFLTSFFILLSCFLGGVVDGYDIDIYLGAFDILISISLLIFAIILHKKFSGVPPKSEKWAKMLKKLNFVSVFWITGRTAKSVLDFLSFISVTAQVTMVFGNSNMTEVIFLILAIFVTEILNIMLTIDYAFFRMFIERDEFGAAQVTSSTESKQMTFKKHRLSMVSANPYIDDKDIELSEEIIGRVNALGKMFKANYLGRQLAYRKIMISNVSTYVTEEVQQEVETYQKLCISGLVRVAAIVLNANTVGLAYPFYQNSLYMLLHVEGKKWKFTEKIVVLAKIAEILADIHAEGKVHGHLTSHNILFDQDEPLVSDLGFHKLKKYIGIKNSYHYKSAWSSPEILKDPRSTPQNIAPMSDVYSFGIICWEVFTENEPFPQFTIEQVKKKVVEEKVRPMIPSDLNLELSRFIQSCFNEDPSIRPDSGSLVSLLNY